MGKIWKKIKGRYLSDRADSILIPALFLIPALALMVGITMEVGKNAYVRSERINAIQDAASSAVSLVDGRGSLDWRVVDRVVNEYEHNRFGKRVFSRTANNRLNDRDKNLETMESKGFDNTSNIADSCLKGYGDDVGQLYPQYKITLNTARAGKEVTDASRTVTFTRTQPTLNELNQMSPLNAVDRSAPTQPKPYVYRSITVEIIDQTPNLVMGMAGVPCQKFNLTASSVTFGADVDLK